MNTPQTHPARRPLPVGTELYLIALPRGWGGELRAGALSVFARGDAPEAVLAELLRLYGEAVQDPLLTFADDEPAAQPGRKAKKGPRP